LHTSKSSFAEAERAGLMGRTPRHARVLVVDGGGTVVGPRKEAELT
jgi:hypothetical protein